MPRAILHRDENALWLIWNQDPLKGLACGCCPGPRVNKLHGQSSIFPEPYIHLKLACNFKINY